MKFGIKFGNVKLGWVGDSFKIIRFRIIVFLA